MTVFEHQCPVCDEIRALRADHKEHHELRIIAVPVPSDERNFIGPYTALLRFCPCGWEDRTESNADAYRVHLT